MTDGQGPPIRRKCQGTHAATQCQLPHHAPLAEIPYPQLPFIAAAGEALSVWRDGEGEDPAGMSRELRRAFPALYLPEADGCALAAACQRGPVRAERQCVHRFFIERRVGTAEDTAAGEFPHLDTPRSPAAARQSL